MLSLEDRWAETAPAQRALVISALRDLASNDACHCDHCKEVAAAYICAADLLEQKGEDA